MEHRRTNDDRGVVIILMALLLVGLLGIVAIVIDLGQLRADRRESQSNTDLAGLAAGFHLAGRGSDTVTSDPRAACAAALASIKLNTPGFPAGATMPCSSLPATAKAPDCTATTSPITIQSAGSGSYQLRITYPVTAALITDSRLSGGTGANDGTAATARCERMTIDLTSTRSTSFAGVFGITSQTVSAKATVRGAAGVIAQGSPAFLILERTACNAFTNSVGGSSRGIIIKSPDGIQPGLAHIDSNGTGSNCSGSARTLVAESLPDGTPSLVVDGNAAGTEPGIIALNALAAGGNESYAYRTYVAPTAPATIATSGGMTVQPTAGRVVSRRPVDQKYNPSTPSTAATIANLHTTARGLLIATGPPAGATEVGCVSGNVPGVNVYVNCDTFNPNPGVVFTEATTVTFSGRVNPGNNRNISFPLAQNIIIRGRLDSNNAGTIAAPRVRNLYVGGGVALNGGTHNFQVNSTAVASCTGGGSTATRFVVFGGNLGLGGNVSLCATTVYLAGPLSRASYAIEQTVTGGSCSASLPCAKGAPDNTITGGAVLVEGGRVLWTAPNEFSGPPPAGSQGLEDLALWTESPATSEVKSGGTVEASGVFFFPNSHVNFSSPTLATPRNAQFIARSLTLLQGTLEMRPVASDSITIPVAGSLSLIR